MLPATALSQNSSDMDGSVLKRILGGALEHQSVLNGEKLTSQY